MRNFIQVTQVTSNNCGGKGAWIDNPLNTPSPGKGEWLGFQLGGGGGGGGGRKRKPRKTRQVRKRRMSHKTRRKNKKRQSKFRINK
jgi:hypothetical protein